MLRQEQEEDERSLCPEIWTDIYEHDVSTNLSHTPSLSLALSHSLTFPPTLNPSGKSTEEVGLAACYSTFMYVNVQVSGVWHLKEVRYCVRTQWVQVLIHILFFSICLWLSPLSTGVSTKLNLNLSVSRFWWIVYQTAERSVKQMLLPPLWAKF